MATLCVTGCSLEAPEEPLGTQEQALLDVINEDDLLAGVTADTEDDTYEGLTEQQRRGKRLFNKGTFGGNGRKCKSCHPSEAGESGSLSPADVQRMFAEDPTHPLFQGDGADVHGGNTFSRILAHATILVDIPLPSNVSIVGSADRSVTLARAIPTTMNTPAVDPVLMYDGRAPDLREQARGAIASHAESVKVSEDQLTAIADFETSLFNREEVRLYAATGAEPLLPAGTTDAEKRGRELFGKFCHTCHAGPMLNETGPMEIVFSNVTPGTRFVNVLVSEANALGNPVTNYAFTQADGTVVTVASADPGLALITGLAEDVGKFKIPILWGSSKTAPYFHDNSAKDLEAVMQHYDHFFRTKTGGVVFLTPQEQADLVEYSKLL